MSASWIDLLALEILILPDVRHPCRHLGNAPAPSALQSSLKDLAMLLLGAVVALGRPLLQGFHQRVVKISDHELGHGGTPSGE
jgi:hypothetical protein